MAEYIERVPFAELIEHLDKKEPCKNCYHRAACDAWVRNVTTLYDDYIYSVENCPYYKPTADVVEVVRCKDCKLYDMRNAKCLLNSEEADQYSRGYDFEMYANDFCSYGERKDS